jgi:Flp pilus assembly protein protease CpaA
MALRQLDWRYSATGITVTAFVLFVVAAPLQSITSAAVVATILAELGVWCCAPLEVRLAENAGAFPDATRVASLVRWPWWASCVSCAGGIVAGYLDSHQRWEIAALGAIVGTCVWTDVRASRIFDVVVALIAVLAVAIVLLHGDGGVPSAVGGLLVCAPLIALAALRTVAAGDVKLMLVLAAALGFTAAVVVTEVAFAALALVLVSRRLRRLPLSGLRIPFAPYVALGFGVAVLLTRV